MVACNNCSVATKDQSQNPVFRKVLWVALPMRQTMQSVYLYWAWHFTYALEPR